MLPSQETAAVSVDGGKIRALRPPVSLGFSLCPQQSFDSPAQRDAPGTVLSPGLGLPLVLPGSIPWDAGVPGTQDFAKLIQGDSTVQAPVQHLETESTDKACPLSSCPVSK